MAALLMSCNPLNIRMPAFSVMLAGIVVCWLVVVFIHLYCFQYPSTDSWSYASPALTARVPLKLTMPFLGTFDGADMGWGLNWPGGDS